MPPQNEEIAPSESLLRHFPSDPGEWIFETKLPRMGMFIPRESDGDGLSTFREVLISPRDVLASCRNENVRTYGGVVSILAGALQNLGLTLKIDHEPPKEQDPVQIPEAHVTITQINRKDYDASKGGKQTIKALATRIVQLFSSHPEEATIKILPTARPVS